MLLVSGAPHAGERVWRDLLKSDPSVDLVHFTILRPRRNRRHADQRARPHRLPAKELFKEKLHDFDLVIFDRFRRQRRLPPALFGDIAVTCAAGAPARLGRSEFIGRGGVWNTQLDAVLPGIRDGRIIETPYRAHVGSKGRAHAVTRDLPNWDSRVTRPWGESLRAMGARVRDGQWSSTGRDRRRSSISRASATARRPLPSPTGSGFGRATTRGAALSISAALRIG